jgi:ribosomal protein S18 acetylase RimI-like enzyme
MLEGGCSCGAVRYRIGQVREAAICHCDACRRATGGAFAAWAEVAPDALQLERGAPRTYRPAGGAGEERAFCAACGTPLWLAGAAWRRVLVGTLDDPAAAPPRVHVAAHRQVPWLRLADLLPWTDELAPPPLAERTIWRGPADPAVTRDAPLTLRPIALGNLREILFLDVEGHQRRMVATNAVSLAQAACEPAAWTRGIYAGDVAVGFAMVEPITEDIGGRGATGDPYVRRFLVDERYQKLGFGRRALELVAEAARQAMPAARALWLSCVPGAHGPYHFYRRAGFEDTGWIEDGEVYLRRAYALREPRSR